MDRIELVELIEAEKAKLSPEGSELWGEFDASLFMSPDEETRLKPHEVAVIDRMADLPESDQHAINRISELRAGLYDSDAVERRGESGVSRRTRSVIHAAMMKDQDEGRQVEPLMSIEQAAARLREG